MAIDLKKIKAEKALSPPRLLWYGPPKVGKSFCFSTIPNSLLVDFEEGSGFLKTARIEKNQVDTFEKFMGLLGDLYTQDHSFSTLGLDTLDWLQDIVFAQAAKEHSKTSIADVGYGAGYVTAQNLWQQIIDGLDALRRDKNMMIIGIAHEQIRRYDNPTTESYDRYTLKLHAKDKGSSTLSIFSEWSDAILFINQETFVRKEKTGFNQETKKASTSDRVFFHTTESPAYLAGNRFGLPPLIPFTWPDLEAALTKAMTTP